jgi:hypothetical protein
VACALSLAAWLALRRSAPTLRLVHTHVRPSLLEFALISGLYGIWRLARQLPFTHEDGALDRARLINELQTSLHLPSEIGMQQLVLHSTTVAKLVNAYYATLHVPALVIFLVWLWVRHREAYPHWRNGLVAVTLGCLVIRFVRVAPPRFVPELGFVDLSQRWGFDVYGDVGRGVSDQFAAMPSIHVGWAAVVALGVFATSKSPWRWIVVAHLPITMVVVAATGHHWWLDGIVAIAFLWIGLSLDRRWRDRPTTQLTGSECVPCKAEPRRRPWKEIGRAHV